MLRDYEIKKNCNF